VKGSDWNRIRYTLYAPVYDQVVARAGFIGPGRQRALALAALRPGERLLIVGAGTGLHLPLVPAGVHITAVDIGPAMVRRPGGARSRQRAIYCTAEFRL
jgi:phosphatidylethanolamine/phosphatidyl-N-methylethanolamine N-methyltransferase